MDFTLEKTEMGTIDGSGKREMYIIKSDDLDHPYAGATPSAALKNFAESIRRGAVSIDH